MNNRRRIALLVAQIHEEYQSDFIEGFRERAFELNYDVCVFACFQKEAESNLREIGESSIFSLINYDKFDGIVVLPDLIRASGFVLKLEEELKSQYRGKVLFVDKSSNFFPSIKIDHYSQMYDLTKHMVDHHGYKDIVFVNGHKWHPHSKEREAAFVTCMMDHGVNITPDKIVYGNYWYDGGAHAIKEYIDTHDGAPRAVIGANDFMAIGAAEVLVKCGYKLPQDVAVIGYEASEASERCPQVISSMFTPSKELGEHAADSIGNLINGNEVEPMKPHAKIKPGHTCGCPDCDVVYMTDKTKKWNVSEEFFSYYHHSNRLTEALVLQSSFKGLIDCIQTYSYQIREFEFFELLLNDVWANKNTPIEALNVRGRFTYQMAPVLKCGPAGKGADVIDYEKRIDTSEMLPELYEDSDKPRCFIFTPLFFDDIVFGYAVIRYGENDEGYTESYYRWMRSIMIGIECYRRNANLIKAKNDMDEIKITDKLTGMFNYEGFVKHANPMIDRAMTNNQLMAVLTIDLAGLEKINSEFGRAEGDRAIKILAGIAQECVDEGAMCCRLGNDEFAIAEIVDDYRSTVLANLKKRINQVLKTYNRRIDIKYPIKVYMGGVTKRVTNLAQMEDLINEAVSQKNGDKANEARLLNQQSLSQEDMEKLDVVRRILDDNLFAYHFQPIVSAKTGEIFAYEALMRATTAEKISPLEILKYATHLSRLVDVEKATFFNVLDFISGNSEAFKERKIFINSIPGSQLEGADAIVLSDKLLANSGRIVVELTEQTQADDETLNHLKSEFGKLGVESAVDDYGTGYSNIVNLLRYMPNYVKIDRMLLSGISENPQKQHFVKDIVIFAHENNFQVLAEGIETSDELRTVIELGVDLIQGYYTARPNPKILERIDPDVEEEIRRYNRKE